ncbi:hypothetical protein QJQ45_025573, partial [Haematococcus lacustris]
SVPIPVVGGGGDAGGISNNGGGGGNGGGDGSGAGGPAVLAAQLASPGQWPDPCGCHCLPGFRERLLGDPSFPVKVAIECGIGVVTKVTAESTKRGDSFWPEIDFVGANVVMAIIADFMLTWIPAPTLSYVPRQVSNNALLTFLSRCPDNAFQRVPAGMEPFTLLQRMGAIARNGGKLLGVGFGASMLGVGITNVLIALRQMMDPGWAPPNKPQDVLATSAAYGVYMSVSSNLRYQLIAGVIEERGIETIFKGQHQLCHVLSFIVRTANTFVGSLLWVDFAAEPTLPTKCKGKAKGMAAEAKPAPRPGRWLDRDCNAARKMQRIGESSPYLRSHSGWCQVSAWWSDRHELPAMGKEYPELGYKHLQDRPSKAQQQQAHS